MISLAEIFETIASKIAAFLHVWPLYNQKVWHLTFYSISTKRYVVVRWNYTFSESVWNLLVCFLTTLIEATLEFDPGTNYFVTSSRLTVEEAWSDTAAVWNINLGPIPTYTKSSNLVCFFSWVNRASSRSNMVCTYWIGHGGSCDDTFFPGGGHWSRKGVRRCAALKTPFLP